MNRMKFYNTVLVDGVEEIDVLHHNLSKFAPKYKMAKHRVEETELQRPDLISYKYYGTVQYWWIICVVNDIGDPFVDIDVGDLLDIPNILDIYDFYKKYNVR